MKIEVEVVGESNHEGYRRLFVNFNCMFTPQGCTYMERVASEVSPIREVQPCEDADAQAAFVFVMERGATDARIAQCFSALEDVLGEEFSSLARYRQQEIFAEPPPTGRRPRPISANPQPRGTHGRFVNRPAPAHH